MMRLLFLFFSQKNIMTMQLIRDVLAQTDGILKGAVVADTKDLPEPTGESDGLDHEGVVISFTRGEDSGYEHAQDDCVVDIEASSVRRLGGWKPKKGDIVNITEQKKEDGTVTFPFIVPSES